MTRTMLAAWAVLALGADAPWPQFRGPGGLGVASGDLPAEWSETKNVAWKTPIPGKGWSSPVVAGGKAWLTTAVQGKGGLSLRVIAIDLAKGGIKHDAEVFSLEKPEPAHPRNNAASPTPCVVGKTLVVSFGGAGVAGVDLASGKVRWRDEKLQANYESGAGSSPVPYKGRVLVVCDGADAQFVAALDAATGEVAWKTERDAAAKKPANERRAFSTPLVITVGKKDQAVVPGAQGVYSYDPATGKELWRVRYAGFSNVPRPVFAHGLVYVCTGYYAHELLAIKSDGSGDVTDTHVAWRVKKAVPNIPSPLVVGDHLFMVADNGAATCLDARTGEAKWTKRLPGSYTASPLAKGETVYAFADDGKATLFKASAKHERLGASAVRGKVQATPAATGKGLLLRTDEALWLLSSEG
ncbi:MAG: PQQ-like beta-propeller repeat protein [Gemmataceae bacterium]|nr:PQQ-like beta-propeller repeat protein [Gemmataceae bacterium]